MEQWEYELEQESIKNRLKKEEETDRQLQELLKLCSNYASSLAQDDNNEDNMKKNICIRMEESLHEELKIYCAKNNTNVSELIEKAVKRLLLSTIDE